MSLQKKPRQTDSHAGASELKHLPAPAARSLAQWISALQAVRHIEDNRAPATDILHLAEAEHIDHQIVIAK
ncbi:hypothetical protein D3C84_871990 [compost metagenome]